MKSGRNGSAWVVCLLILVILTGAAYAAENYSFEIENPGAHASSPLPHPDHRFTENGPVLVFFYNTNCADCIKTHPYVLEYIRTHPELEAHLIDIGASSEKRELFTIYKDAFRTGFIPVPAVFVGNATLVGYEEITLHLEDAVRVQAPGSMGPVTHSSSFFFPIGDVTAQDLTIPLVITAGLADGINPCAFSVLIILLFTLAAAGSRRKMVVVGAGFIGAVFVFYFLSGMGLFYLIQSAAISRAIGIIAALIAFALGIVSLYDGIRGDGKPALAIPESKKGIIDRYIQKGSVPAALILGVLVGMFELPCTGGIYLAILSLISNQMTLAEGIPLLFVYNIFFVMPLVLILCAVVLGLPLERVDRWRQEHRGAVRILMGLVLIGLGLLLAGTLIAG
ncbi:MAG: Cytochrome C biogenesis protein transmembrane region [Methanoregulaceae archaeon PtaB.Bin152]|nr:MAG: Cytochrome C biogenesis protein transmembrane region [Methanoregulaceae archaeon PtaB.Bin152]